MSARQDPEDGRLTYGLLFAVYDLLDAHGYKRGDVAMHADALVALLRLTEAYEGAAVRPDG